jgi:hypothetical protein
MKKNIIQIFDWQISPFGKENESIPFRGVLTKSNTINYGIYGYSMITTTELLSINIES